jgi:LacI family transcriptional regulator
MLAAHQHGGVNHQMPTRKAVRLKDVADAAGVSVMAASHVLNGSGMGRVSVSPAKTLKIQNAADKLGYRRNIAASMLRGGSSDVIGAMIYPACANASELLDELRLAAAARGKLLLTARTLRSSSTPALTVALAGGDADVVVDRSAALQLALAHLKEMRRRRIVLLTPKDPPEAAAGYKKLARSARDAVSKSLSVNVHPYEGGYAVHAKPYLSLVDEVMRRYAPDAIIADSDEAAVSMLRALRRRGARVPESISVIGWGNTALAKSFDPLLTSVGIDHSLLARTVLDRLLSSGSGTSTTLVPQLFVRETA